MRFSVSTRFKTFFHGHSYTGNQLGAAVALASWELLHRRRPRSTQGNGAGLARELDSLWALAAVGDVRREGLAAGVELVADWKTRRAFALKRSRRHCVRGDGAKGRP